MNIALTIEQINIDLYVKLLDKRRNNIIMDGEFTKLLYSDEFITLNGIYLVFPIIKSQTIIESIPTKNCYNGNQMNKSGQKKLIFQPNHPMNIHLIQQIALFEKQLLRFYKESTFSEKNPVYSLQNQLMNGFIKAFYDNGKENAVYYIKISGIWETAKNVGITYKFIEGSLI